MRNLTITKIVSHHRNSHTILASQKCDYYEWKQYLKQKIISFYSSKMILPTKSIKRFFYFFVDGLALKALFVEKLKIYFLQK